MTTDPVLAVLSDVSALEPQLIATRRDIHRNPELSWQETRTTALVTGQLRKAGWRLRPLHPTGVVADLGPQEPAFVVALRADLDALPLAERTGLPWSSRVTGVSHACGHDVHTTALLGAGLALARRRADLDGRGLGVRLIFQPAEETMPGGGLMLAGTDLLDDVDQVFAVHCDPRLDVGTVGLRVGPVTAASDQVRVRLTGDGGHTSRPHLTHDLTYALAKVVTDVPAALSRRVDPRSAAALVWGRVSAGHAPNVIPDSGEVAGTLRMLDAVAWESIGPLLRELIEAVVAPYGVRVDVEHVRGVPPVVNSADGVDAASVAARTALGPESVGPTEQSMGGEDFAWILTGRSGALVRLGSRTPHGTTYDLHRGDLVIDEAAVTAGARLFATLPFAAQGLSQARAVLPDA